MKKLKKDHDQNERHRIPEISKSGYKRLRQKHYREARSEFGRILEMDRKNIYALVGMGDSYRGERSFKNAIEYYELALASDPVNKFAFIGLADTYRGMRNFDRAIEIWEDYLAGSGNEYDISVLTRLGDTYRKTGKTGEAIERYKAALAIDPANPYALSGLGHLYFEKRNYKEALTYWHRLLESSKYDVKVLTNTGNCYRKLKQYNEAIKYFYRAMNREEDNFYALYGIADCYRGLHEYEKAAEYWNKILDIDPNNKKILTRLGDAYRNLDRIETARTYYKKAIEKEFDYYAILGLGMLDMMEKNYEAAIDNFNQLKNISSLNYQLTILLSECYSALNKNEMSIEVLSQAIQKGINSRELRKRLHLLREAR